MKKGLFALGMLAFAAALAVPSTAQGGAVYAEVQMAPVGRHYGAPPPLGRKQGWLSITNRDWTAYTLVVGRNEKLFLYRADSGQGGMLLPSGATVTVALEKDTYELYGSSSDKLKVKIREGRSSTLSLEPFGPVGSTGLRGVSNDGDRVRSEVLIDAYMATVVVPQPTVVVPQPTVVVPQPTVVVRRPPPPPPVIVARPPVYHSRPSTTVIVDVDRRSRHHRRDGWGFMFGYSGR